MRIFNFAARFVSTVIVLLFFVIAGSCARTTIKYSYNQGMNFAGFKSYKWGPTTAPVLAGQYSLVDVNVQFIADQKLKQKGFYKASENPDFVVSILYDCEIGRSQYDYQLRMLTLKVHQADREETIWQGTASGIINVDATSDDLKDAVQDILAKFPVSSVALPKDVQLSNIGFKYIQQGNYVEAEKYLNKALSENSNNPYAILNLGVVYQNTGHSADARKVYEKLIMLNPPDIAVVSNKTGAKGKTLVDIAKENLQNLK